MRQGQNSFRFDRAHFVEGICWLACAMSDSLCWLRLEEFARDVLGVLRSGAHTVPAYIRISGWLLGSRP